MRAFTDIDEELERVIVTFATTMVLGDIMEMMFTSEKASVLGFPTLLDARDVRIEITHPDIEAIFVTHRHLAGKHRMAKLAVLVNDLGALATVEDAASLLTQVSPIRGFLDRSEAEHWLGWAEQRCA